MDKVRRNGWMISNCTGRIETGPPANFSLSSDNIDAPAGRLGRGRGVVLALETTAVHWCSVHNHTSNE